MGKQDCVGCNYDEGLWVANVSTEYCGSEPSSTLRGFFFFQAEDGIRDVAVTGVQTCALPISVNVPAGFARQPYGGNIIPATDPLLSSLGAFMAPLIPNPDRNTLAVNGFGGTSDDNNKIHVRTWLFRIDHTFNSKFSISNTYYQNNRPRVAHCGGPQGCNTVHDGETDSAANDTYIGQGFFQRITNHFDHLQMNWIISPNLFNHTTLAYDRWHMQGNQLAGGVGWNQKLGLGLPNQPVFDKAGFPSINFSGPQGYTAYGTPWASGGGGPEKLV